MFISVSILLNSILLDFVLFYSVVFYFFDNVLKHRFWYFRLLDIKVADFLSVFCKENGGSISECMCIRGSYQNTGGCSGGCSRKRRRNRCSSGQTNRLCSDKSAADAATTSAA